MITHKLIKKLFFFTLFFIPLQVLNAQELAASYVKILNIHEPGFPALDSIPVTTYDSTDIVSKLKTYLDSLHFASFLEASIDSLYLDDSTALGFLHRGSSYQWAYLNTEKIPEGYLRAIGYREDKVKKLSFEDIQAIKVKLLNYAENNGFPFAIVSLEDIQFVDTFVSGALRLELNKFITFSAIKIEGNANISPVFLANYLSLPKESPYKEKRVREIKRKLLDLPYLQEYRDLVVFFQGEEATVNLFLEKKRSSRFDFLLGFLPREQNSVEERQPLLLTGQLNADLFNPFGLGERIKARFQQFRPGTQELQLGFNLPYAVGLPFGADLGFELYRRDSTYLDVILDLGMQYLFEGNNYVKIFWNRTSTTLISIDEEQIRNTQALPTNLDVANTTVGLEYYMQRLDYRFNPRRGWSVFAKGGVGNKRISRSNLILSLNDSTDNFDYNTLYDSLNERTFQFRIHGEAAYYLPIMKRSTLKLGLSGGYLESEEQLFRNELYRIGGNQLLRGFDEESIFAGLYTILTLEYRLLLDRNSYLFTFADLGYYERPLENNFLLDRPRGFGGGVTFETKVGVFGLSLAWGTQRSIPVDFSAPKVHFGYVSLF